MNTEGSELREVGEPKEETQEDKQLVELAVSKLSFFKILYQYGAFSVLFVLLLDWIAKTAAILVLPLVLLNIYNGDVSFSSYISGIMQGIIYTFQMILAPAFGTLSDKYGRRPFILLMVVSVFIAYFIYALSTSGLFAYPIVGLFIAVIFFGINSPITAICCAWIIDKSALQSKAERKHFTYSFIGILNAAVGVGAIFGAILSVIIGQVSPNSPQRIFVIDVGILAFETIIAFFFIFESREKDDQPSIPWYQSNPFSTIVWMFKINYIPSFIFFIFFANLAHNIAFANFVLWAEFRFAWNNTQVGIAVLIFGGVAALTQSVIVKVASPFLGETLIYIFAGVMGAGAYLGFALTPSDKPYLVYVFAILLGLHTISHPLTIGIMSRQVEKHEQGRMLGGGDIVRLFASIITSFGSTALFGYLVSPDRQTPLPNVIFYIAAGCIVVSILFILPLFLRHSSLLLMEKDDRLKATKNTLAEPLLPDNDQEEPFSDTRKED